jgi:predicted ATP-grasp superfamily ATP-dependent carboligase
VRTIVIDRFGDIDTARLAARCIALPPAPGLRGHPGFARGPFLAALGGLRSRVEGLVYGAGFEHDPALLADAADIVPILGNPSEVVAEVKDPFRFAELLARLGLPHPPVRKTPAGRGWLRKTAGGSGGTHIIRAVPKHPVPSGSYFQKSVAGRSVSAAFVADGRTACLVGFTEQWTSATATAPFRYGGCAGPVQLPPKLASAIAAACSAITGAVPLVGLNSLDILVDGTGFHILEVNPRPGASLDVLDGICGRSLWRLHRAALDGKLPTPQGGSTAARAAQVVYARRRCTIPAGFEWPTWTADRGPPGTVIRRDEPICTVMAVGTTAALARHRVEMLVARLLVRLSPSSAGAPYAQEAALA